MNTDNPWLYQGKEWQLPEEFNPDVVYGFVYLITNKMDQKKYVGKKFFWSQKTLPITKKRKRRKRLKVESDWRTYWGSNKYLVEDVKTHGPENFTREILHLCKTKGECAYYEAKEQFDREVLLTEEYYNGIISCKIGGRTVKNLIK
tara:strand:+ start:3873 stop:4310 length:438 start_codon:yes stop_codon:yes gene_type:complete